MELTVKNKTYYTNISHPEMLNKCVDFFLDGCTSYAISFENEPKTMITRQKIKGIDCMLLRDFNNECKFVPVHAKDETTFEGILSKGLDSIEIV